MSQSGITGISSGMLPPGVLVTITGNDGVPETAIGNNFNLLTAHSTVKFLGSAATETLDFGQNNLILGSSPPIAGAIQSVGIGSSALNALTSGSENTSVGYFSLVSATTSPGNSAFGNSTLGALVGGSGLNSAFGISALGTLISGTRNSALGNSSGTGITTGNYGLFLGQGAGNSYTSSESSNILLMNAGVIGESNVMRLGTTGSGNGQVSQAFVAGTTGVTVAASAPVGVASTGQFSSLGFGTSGQFFISNGNGVSPTFQSAGALVGSTITGDTGGALAPSSGNWNLKGDTNTIKVTGSGSTETFGLQTQVLQPSGTAAAPSYSFQGSAAIGMFSSAGNTLAFAANGTNLLELQGNGTLHPKGPVLLESGLGYNITEPAGSTTTTVNDGFIGVNTAAARTITLVASPDFGQIYRIQDITGSGATNNITIAGNGKLINGASTFTINTNYGAAELVYDGTAWYSTVSIATSASTLITTYDTAASPATWTKNPRTVFIEVFGWAGGSGGGSGRKGTSTASSGGGGGGSGGSFYFFGPATSFGPTESVIIGSGGTGGAAQSTDLTNGISGNVGTLTSFGVMKCLTGTVGAGGSTTTGNGGTPGTFISPLSANLTGGGIPAGSGSNNGGGNASTLASNALMRSTPGGGGAGYDLITPRQGGSGGAIQDITPASIVTGGTGGLEGGTINGGNGNVPLTTGGPLTGGTGGGGGGGPSAGTTVGNGGNGAIPGGGGGGGSGGISGTTSSGAGGNGANGRVIVIEHF